MVFFFTQGKQVNTASSVTAANTWFGLQFIEIFFKKGQTPWQELLEIKDDF